MLGIVHVDADAHFDVHGRGTLESFLWTEASLACGHSCARAAQESRGVVVQPKITLMSRSLALIIPLGLHQMNFV